MNRNCQDVNGNGHPFDWRNPPYWFRVVAVAVVWSLPGTFLGAIASLYFGELILCTIIGAVFGALLGGMMEAWPYETGHDEHGYWYHPRQIAPPDHAILQVTTSCSAW